MLARLAQSCFEGFDLALRLRKQGCRPVLLGELLRLDLLPHQSDELDLHYVSWSSRASRVWSVQAIKTAFPNQILKLGPRGSGGQVIFGGLVLINFLASFASPLLTCPPST